MRSRPINSPGQVKAQVNDRIGQFRWIDNRDAGQEIFDIEFNAFETGCVMRWLERRWSRADLAGSSFLLQGVALHLQVTQPAGPGAKELSAGGGVSFENWMRRITRMADQSS